MLLKKFWIFNQPIDKAAMHHHPDHIFYVLNGGKVNLITEEKVDIMKLKTDEAVFMNEQSHEVQNIGDNVIDLLVVELK